MTTQESGPGAGTEDGVPFPSSTSCSTAKASFASPGPVKFAAIRRQMKEQATKKRPLREMSPRGLPDLNQSDASEECTQDEDLLLQQVRMAVTLLSEEENRDSPYAEGLSDAQNPEVSFWAMMENYCTDEDGEGKNWGRDEQLAAALLNASLISMSQETSDDVGEVSGIFRSTTQPTLGEDGLENEHPQGLDRARLISSDGENDTKENEEAQNSPPFLQLPDRILARQRKNPSKHKGSPFTTFRQNSTDVAIQESGFYLKKIEELEAALAKAEKRAANERRLMRSPNAQELGSGLSQEGGETPASMSNIPSMPTPETLWERNKTLVKEIRFADQTCVELSGQKFALEKEVSSLRDEVEELREQKTQKQALEIEVSNLKDKVYELQCEQARKAAQEREVGLLKEQLNGLQRENWNLMEEVKTCCRESAAAEAKCNNMESRVAELVAAGEARLCTIEQARKTIAELQGEIEALKGDLHLARVDAGLAKDQSKAAQARLAKVEEDSEVETQRAQKLSNAMQQQLESLRAALQVSNDNAGKWKQKCRESEARLCEAETTAKSQVELAMAEYEAREKDRCAKNESVRRQLEASQRECCMMAAECQSLKKELLDLQETAKQKSESHAIELNSLKVEIEQLKRKQRDSDNAREEAVAISQSLRSRLEKAERDLAKHSAVAQDKQAVSERTKIEMERLQARLDDTHAELDATRAEGQATNLSLAETLNRIAQLEADLFSARGSTETLACQLSTCQSLKKELLDLQETAKQKTESQAIELNSLKVEIEQLKRKQRVSDNAREEAVATSQSLRSRLEKAEIDLAKHSAVAQDKRAVSERTKIEMERLQARLHDAHAELDATRAEGQATKLSLAESLNRIAQLEADLFSARGSTETRACQLSTQSFETAEILLAASLNIEQLCLSLDEATAKQITELTNRMSCLVSTVELMKNALEFEPETDERSGKSEPLSAHQISASPELALNANLPFFGNETADLELMEEARHSASGTNNGTPGTKSGDSLVDECGGSSSFESSLQGISHIFDGPAETSIDIDRSHHSSLENPCLSMSFSDTKLHDFFSPIQESGPLLGPNGEGLLTLSAPRAEMPQMETILEELSASLVVTVNEQAEFQSLAGQDDGSLPEDQKLDGASARKETELEQLSKTQTARYQETQVLDLADTRLKSSAALIEELEAKLIAQGATLAETQSELAAAQESFGHLMNERKSLLERLESSVDDIEKLDLHSKAIGEALDEAVKECVRLKSTAALVDKLRDERDGFEKEANTLRAEVQQLHLDLESTIESLIVAKDERDTFRSQTQDTAVTNAVLERDLHTLREAAKNSTAEIKHLHAELESKVAALTTALADRDTLLAERAEIAATVVICEDQARNLQSALDESGDRLEQLKAENSNLHSLECKLRRAMEETSERLHETESKLREREQALRALQKEKDNAKAQRSRLLEEFRLLQRQLKISKDMVSKLEADAEDREATISKLSHEASVAQQRSDSAYSSLALEAVTVQSELESSKELLQAKETENAALLAKNDALDTKCSRLREYARKLAAKCDEWEDYYDAQALVLENLMATSRVTSDDNARNVTA